MVNSRCRAGRFTRVHRGVYLLGRESASGLAGALAAVLATQPHSLLSRGHALWLWGAVAEPTGPSHIIAPARRSQPRIATHRGALHPDDLCALDYIPVTSPARSLLDTAMGADPGEIERAANELRAVGLLPAAELDALRTRTAGHHGWRVLGPLLASDRETGFSRKEAELRLWRLVREAGLLPAKRNVRLHGWEVDTYWPDAGLVVEVDGFDFHSGRAAFERDRRKQAELQDHGLEVMRFTWLQIIEQPLWVAARIAARLAARRPGI